MTKPLKKSAADMIAEAAAAASSPKIAANQSASVVADEPKRRNATKASTKQLTLYLADPTYRQLREIAFNEDTKMHPLILEALDMLFAARGRPQIAQAVSER